MSRRTQGYILAAAAAAATTTTSGTAAAAAAVAAEEMVYLPHGGEGGQRKLPLTTFTGRVVGDVAAQYLESGVFIDLISSPNCVLARDGHFRTNVGELEVYRFDSEGGRGDAYVYGVQFDDIKNYCEAEPGRDLYRINGEVTLFCQEEQPQEEEGGGNGDGDGGEGGDGGEVEVQQEQEQPSSPEEEPNNNEGSQEEQQPPAAPPSDNASDVEALEEVIGQALPPNEPAAEENTQAEEEGAAPAAAEQEAESPPPAAAENSNAAEEEGEAEEVKRRARNLRRSSSSYRRVLQEGYNWGDDIKKEQPQPESQSQQPDNGGGEIEALEEVIGQALPPNEPPAEGAEEQPEQQPEAQPESQQSSGETKVYATYEIGLGCEGFAGPQIAQPEEPETNGDGGGGEAGGDNRGGGGNPGIVAKRHGFDELQCENKLRKNICHTAWMYTADNKSCETTFVNPTGNCAVCIRNLDMGMVPWGYFVGPYNLKFGLNKETMLKKGLKFIAGAAHCNNGLGEDSARVIINSDGETVTIRIEADCGFTLKDLDLYIGPEFLPMTPMGLYQWRPEQFPYHKTELDGQDTVTFEVSVDDLEDADWYYIALHGTICKGDA